MVGFSESESKQPSVRDAWRCTSCQRLMYNLDSEGYPCLGAPIPLWVDKRYIAVCSVCYEMANTIDHADWTYWHSLPPTKNRVALDPVHTYDLRERFPRPVPII